MSRIIAALLAATALVPAAGRAARTREPSLAERYVRIAAANAGGDVATASSQMAALLQRVPNSPEIALRAYRQAITAGDHPLASRALKLLDQQKAMPVDGPLLLVVDTVQARDWAGARAATMRLEQGKLFAFMAPLLRAWITVAAKDGDPLTALAPARALGMAQGYYPEQHALLLVATGRVAEGAAEIRGMRGAGLRLKIIAAAALFDAPDRPGALAMLTGDEPPLAAARARIAAGRRPLPALDGATGGMAELFAHVALDFGNQRLAPVATVMARLATFVAPEASSGWLGAAQVLAQAKRPDAALAALDRVAAADAFAGVAQTMRIGLLVDKDDKPRALDEALRAARGREAGGADWARVGDVYMAMDRFADAAAAYAKAIALIGTAPPAQLWPYWLQQGTALEQAGDWPRAKAALEQAYALAPDQPVVLNHLGYSQLARREDVARADALIAEASRLRPDDPAITDSLGWSRFVLGKPGEAAPLLERAAAGAPDEPTINEHLGDVYWTLGRRLEARYAWRAALVTAETKDASRLTDKIDGGLTQATAAP